MNRPTFVFIDSPYDAHDAVLECIITEGMQKKKVGQKELLSTRKAILSAKRQIKK